VLKHIKSNQNSDEVSGSKAEKRKYQRYLEVRDSSNDVMHCDVWLIVVTCSVKSIVNCAV
jgi:hypothetical protein